MSKYQFGSIVNRDFRRTLQRLADDSATQGKAIQDLVAEGQLTPNEYAHLITTINGLIKSGDVKLDDLNDDLKQEIEKISRLPSHSDMNDKINNKLGHLSDATPLFAENVSEMSDGSRMYVNRDDGYLYFYDGSYWVNTNVLYQSQVASSDKVIRIPDDYHLNSDNQEDVNKELAEQISPMSASLKNILLNSEFKDTKHWEALYDSADLSVLGGVLSVISNGTNANPQVRQDFLKSQSGRFYIKGRFKINNPNCTGIRLTFGSDNGFAYNINDFIVDQWYEFTIDTMGLIVPTDTLDYLVIQARHDDVASATSTVLELKELCFVNIKETYGNTTHTAYNHALKAIQDNSVSGWFKDKLSLWHGKGENLPYNVLSTINTLRAYGAVGDGITDDSEAIQRALNDTDIIIVGDGVYKITKTLKVKSHKRIIGIGDRSKFAMRDGNGLTAYQWRTDGSMPNYFPYFVTEEGSQDIVIENIFIEGDKVNFINHIEVGLAIDGARNVELKNVHISHVNYHPSRAPARPSGQFRTGWNLATFRSDDITIDGGLYEYGGYECVRFGDNTTNATLKNATIQYGWRTAFQILRDSDDVKIENCIINQDDFDKYDTHAAITLHSAAGHPIKNVKIISNKINGKLFSEHHDARLIATVDMYNENIQVIDNEIQTNGHLFNPLFASGKVIVKDNRGVASGGRGISVMDGTGAESDLIIEDNDIKSKSLSLSVEGEHHTKIKIKGNTLTSEDEHTIYINVINNPINRGGILKDNILTPNISKDALRVTGNVTLTNAVIEGNIAMNGDYAINLPSTSIDNIVKNNIVKHSAKGVNAPEGNLISDNL